MQESPGELDDTFEYNPTDQAAGDQDGDHLFESGQRGENQKLQNRINLGNNGGVEEEEKEEIEGKQAEDDYEI